MGRPALVLATLLGLLAPLLAGALGAQAEAGAGLPPGPGRDEVEVYCSPCHSLNLVIQQGLGRADWDELLVWMVEEQGMAEIPEEDRAIVLDYLAREISVERVRGMRQRR